MKTANKNWIALYTRPKWEKKVNYLLQQQGIDTFCPLVKAKRQWADRLKTVEIPLFNSYVFARVNPLEQSKIEQISGVVNIVYHCGAPAKVTAEEISRIKVLLEQEPDQLESIPLEELNTGSKIKVKDGILSDWQGEVITVRGKSVVMLLKQFNCALIAKVEIRQPHFLRA